jgi:hypothetical protein
VEKSCGSTVSASDSEVVSVLQVLSEFAVTDEKGTKPAGDCGADDPRSDNSPKDPCGKAEHKAGRSWLRGISETGGDANDPEHYCSPDSGDNEGLAPGGFDEGIDLVFSLGRHAGIIQKIQGDV